MKVFMVRVAPAMLATMVWAAAAGQAGFGQSQTQPTGGRQFAGSGSAPYPAPYPASGGWHYFGEANAAAAPKPVGAAPKAASGAVKTNLSPRSTSIIALERQMYELINRDRLDPTNLAETGGHAAALRWNATLAAAAREHSRDMLRQKFFAHVDPEGRSPGTRVKAAGIDWQAVGENIAIYESVASAQAAFMNEPRFGQNHRSNILDPKYTEVGVGIVQAPDGRYYITQEFVETPQSLRAAFP